ncbi:MAG: amidohydrolase family protein [Alphaproteobacteria bacterium]|nr:amidohydrolase family protein [Alphaproteobacteria bacterium]
MTTPLLPLLLACSSTPAQLTLDPPESFTIRDVAVFDPDTRMVVPGQDVAVADGRIVSVQATGGPVYDTVVVGTGATLLPGLIDAHVHVGSPVSIPGQLVPPDPVANLQSWLAAGATTVMDMGGRAPDTRKAAAAEATPRVYVAHLPITTKGGHPLVLGKALLPWPVDAVIAATIPQVDRPEDAAKVIEDTLAQDPAWVKLICDELPVGAPEMSDEVLAALVTEAHARGARVVVHIGDEHNALAAVRAGADLLVHGIWRGGLSEEGLAELAASGVPVVATLYGFEATADLMAGRWQPSALDRSLGYGEVSEELIAGREKIVRKYPAFTSFAGQIDPGFGEVTRRMHDAGVPVLVGTDAPLPGIWPGSGLHREMAALVDAGMPPADVLAGATGKTADWLAGDPALGVDFGRIAPGQTADLLLVVGDPTRDITATQDIAGVWRAGRRVRPLGPE